jgi:hypothetical protein
MGQLLSSSNVPDGDAMETLNLIEDDLQEVQVDHMTNYNHMYNKENDFKMMLKNYEPIDFTKEKYLIQDDTEKMK